MFSFDLSAILPVRQLKASCQRSVNFEEPIGMFVQKEKKEKGKTILPQNEAKKRAKIIIHKTKCFPP